MERTKEPAPRAAVGRRIDSDEEAKTEIPAYQIVRAVVVEVPDALVCSQESCLILRSHRHCVVLSVL